jgi:hypothetical protein
MVAGINSPIFIIFIYGVYSILLEFEYCEEELDA